MEKKLLTMLFVCLPLFIWADPIEVDGIYYNLITKGKIAEVTKHPNGYNIIDTLVIPASITYNGEEYSVARIVDGDDTGYWNGVFANCNGITSVILPTSLTRIGKYAFAGCSGLSNFEIPNGVKEIGEAAFYNSSITSVSVPSSVTTIEGNAFRDCSRLDSVLITDIEAWCKTSFMGGCYTAPFCGTFADRFTAYHLYLNGEEIKDLVIPNSIKNIGNNIFYGCVGLSSVTIPEGVTTICSGAFFGCQGLTCLAIPKTISSIGSEAFRFCSNLSSVQITDIEAWCQITFDGNVSDYWLVSNPLAYAHHLFLNGEEIKDLVIPNSITNIRSLAFYGCDGLTNITIPSSVTSIGNGAFWGCRNLSSVIIPNDVTTIEESAFANCSSVTSLIIGESVSSIGSKAFATCKELADVYCYAENVPSTDVDAFEESYIDYATLHVPESSISTYETVVPWNNFKNTVKIMPMYILTYLVDGEIFKLYQVEEGTAITPEAEPTREGYSFSGWSEIPETMPAHDVTITGSFSINKYKLIYKVDGEEYKSYDVEYGAAITPEAAPTKEGYTFSGWSEIPTTMPANDVTVTGSFSINKYKLIYKVDGEEYKSYDVEYGAAITPEAAPTKEGYTFSGWSEIPETMPAYDVTITGSFTQIDYVIGDATYEVSGDEVSVIKGNNYTGDVEISSTIVINDKTYTVTSIAEGAFKNNTNITSVTIPESVNSIGANAFDGCSGLTSINVGKAVTSIGSKAFANLTPAAKTRALSGLTISCYATNVPTTASDAFENTSTSNATLLVDDNSVEAYKTSAPWSDFGTIMGFNEAAGMDGVLLDNGGRAKIFSIDGKPLNEPQKGVNIIRMDNGKTMKVVVK